MADQPTSAACPAHTAWRHWLHAAALVALYLGSLGVAPLFDVDEGAFAEASREMVTSGDWLHTTLNGADRFDKPILVYWLQALSLSLFGINEWAVRLPSAVCALAMCWQTGRLAACMWGEPLRWPTTWLMAAAPGVLIIGRAATADALLNLLLVLTGLCLLRFVQSGRTRPLRAAALWTGLGLLAKGPVAVLIPGASLLIWSGLTDRGQRLRQALADWPSWLLMLVIPLPWYAYAWHRHGQAFIDGFWVRHNLERFSGPLEGHGGSLLYYMLALPLLWLPWTVWLAWAGVQARHSWRDAERRFLLVWAGFVLVFFSLSGTKLPHYALYASLPCVLLIAHTWTRPVPGGVQWAAVLNASLLPTLLCAGTFWAAHLGAQQSDGLYAQLFQAAPATPWLLGAGLLATLSAGAWSLPRRTQPCAWVAPVAALCIAHFTGWLVPWWGNTLQSPVKDAALWANTHDLPLVQWQVHVPSAGFYRQAPVPRRPPGPADVALMRTDRLPASGYRLLGQWPGYALAQPQPPASNTGAP